MPVADSQLKREARRFGARRAIRGIADAGAIHRRRLDGIVAEDQPMQAGHVERRRQHRMRRRLPCRSRDRSAMPAGPPLRNALIGPAPHAVTNTDRNTQGIQARMTAARSWVTVVFGLPAEAGATSA